MTSKQQEDFFLILSPLKLFGNCPHGIWRAIIHCENEGAQMISLEYCNYIFSLIFIMFK
jgi:hypothetical protein